MRFLHPGRSCAAKFASSTAELGWDGSLLHCKSRGRVVPSFGWRLTKSARFSLLFRSSRGGDNLLSGSTIHFRVAAGVWTPAAPETSSGGRRKRRGACVPYLARPHRARYGNPRMASSYQTRQDFAGNIGWPLVQPNALPNSSKFCTEPLTRQRPGECGSVSADWRADCSVWFWHHTCAKPRK